MPGRLRTALTFMCIALGVVSPWSAASRSAAAPMPLPDREAFLAQVRARLRTDDELQNQYTYLEKRQEVRVGKLGKVQLGDVRLFEVYPPAAPGDAAYRRLIAVNGASLSPDVLRQRDQERQQFLADRTASLAHESPADRARRERKQADERQRRQDQIDDVFRVYEMNLTGRDTIDGHSAIVVSLTPRAGVETRSEVGKYLSRFGGQAWVSEDDEQPIKLEVEAQKDLLMGLGILARIERGSRLTWERRKVNDEVWLPARTKMEIAGRTLLVRKFSVAAETEFSDYKKFDVTSSETYTPHVN